MPLFLSILYAGDYIKVFIVRSHPTNMRYVLFVIVALLLGGVVFVMLQEKPEEALRKNFVDKCLTGQTDTKQYITALKTNRVELCTQITDKNSAVFCEAEIKKDAQTCNAISIPEMAKYCESVISRDKDACGTDNECLAYVAGEVSYCDKLSSANVGECKAVILRDETLLKESDCDDMSYLLLGKQDKSWCRKISDERIRQECY